MTDNDIEVQPEDEKRFEVFNSDISLFIFRMLLERRSSSDEPTYYELSELAKQSLWSLDEFTEELMDGSYACSEGLLLHKIMRILDALDMSEDAKVCIEHVPSILNTILREFAKQHDGNQPEAVNEGYIDACVALLTEAFEIRKKSDAINKELIQNDKVTSKTFGRLCFAHDEYSKHFSYLPMLAASHIEIEVHMDENKLKKANQRFTDYIYAFSRDEYIEHPRQYKYEDRRNFADQLERFQKYARGLPHTQESVSIPHTALQQEEEFEVVKILSYLELEEKATVHKWNSLDNWRVTFETMPVTGLSWLDGDATNAPSIDNLKGNLSFDEAKGVLALGERSIKVGKTTDQYQLLRIIFTDKDEIGKEWFYSEIAEKYDSEANIKDKKFYNAAYQLKQKIAASMHIDDVLITSQSSVHINPKYLSEK